MTLCSSYTPASLASAAGSDVGGAMLIAKLPVAFKSSLFEERFQWKRHQMSRF
jgi:hypothetical protein